MHTEWWNELEMSEDDRALERREHQLRAMNNGRTIQIMPGSKEEMRSQLDRLIAFDLSIQDERIEFFNQFRDDDTPPRPPSSVYSRKKILTISLNTDTSQGSILCFPPSL